LKKEPIHLHRNDLDDEVGGEEEEESEETASE